jgi:REase_DpnII-MboI
MADDKRIRLKGMFIRVDGLRRAMETVMNGTTPDHGKWGAFGTFARAYNALAKQYVAETGDSINTYDLSPMKGFGDTVWPAQKQIFDMIYADTLILSGILSAYEVGESASVSAIQDMMVANLRKVIFTKPERELEVQNAIESLIIGRGYQKGVNYDRESGKVKFSGKEFIPDFIFYELSLALEMKLIRDKSHISPCIEEMSADATAYTSVYNNVLFCVYDNGVIRDVNEFQNGLQKENGVRVCVIKH